MFYDDYFLNPFQRTMVTNFIKKQMGDKNNNKVDRIRPWLLAKINQSHVHPSNILQKGCPDIIPGLRAKPWWYTIYHLGIDKSFLGYKLSNRIIK